MNDDPKPEKTRGEVFEKIAFNFCKAATLVLLTGRFALPVAAALAAIFFVLAHCNGQSESRCILKKPLLIAAFWIAVCGFWLWRNAP